MRSTLTVASTMASHRDAEYYGQYNSNPYGLPNPRHRRESSSSNRSSQPLPPPVPPRPHAVYNNENGDQHQVTDYGQPYRASSNARRQNDEPPRLITRRTHQRNRLCPHFPPTMPTIRKSITTRSSSKGRRRSTIRVRQLVVPWSTVRALTTPTDPIFLPHTRLPTPILPTKLPCPFPCHMATLPSRLRTPRSHHTCPHDRTSSHIVTSESRN